MRRFLAVLLIALALATLAVYARAVMAPLTLSIGSGSVALVQTGSVVRSLSGTAASPTLATPSTAGTCLIFIVGQTGPAGTSALPAGWTRLGTIQLPVSLGIFDVWAYLNNPGGISSVTWTTTTVGTSTTASLSEWTNVYRASTALEASGTLSATAGTTLAPTTTTAVLSPGDLAISAWLQQATLVAAVTFTTPSGWTRLADNGSDATAAPHLDSEYQLSPAAGILGPTLTSTGTTFAAAGIIVVLKAAPPVTDQTAMLAY